MTTVQDNPPQDSKSNGKPQKFTVELGDAYNRSITIDTLKQQFRGHFNLAKLHNRPGGGRGDTGDMSAMPEIPGMHLEVDPKECKVRIYDPLSLPKGVDVLKQVNAVRDRAGVSGAKFRAVPEVVRDLTEDEMKSLCLELVLRVAQKKAKVREGVLPSEDQIKKLPGEELYDPWSESRTQPKYKKDVPAYERMLAKAGPS